MINVRYIIPIVCLLASPAMADQSPAIKKNPELQVVEKTTKKTFLNIVPIENPYGIQTWLVEDHSLPIVAMDIVFIGSGARNETSEKQGLARLASNTMDEGAGEYDSKTFQKLLTDNSIGLSFGSSRDHFSAALKTLSKNKDLAFTMLAEALNNPRFDTEPVERMRLANQSRMRSSMSNSGWITARIMNDRVFAGDAYAQNSGGTLSTMAALTSEDLKAFKKDNIARTRARVAIVGDMTPDQVRRRLDQIFAAMPAGVLASEMKDVSLSLGQNYQHEMNIPQSSITIVSSGISRNDPDYQAAKIMSFILGGGGFGSRLMEEAREKRGLTYGIYSGLQNLDRTEIFSVTTSTKNASAQEMLTVIESELLKMKNQGVTEVELKNAKSYLIGSLPLSLTSTSKISGLMSSMQVSNRAVDYLERREENLQLVTIEDIKRVANSILTSKRSVIVVGHPLDLDGDYTTITTLPNVE